MVVLLTGLDIFPLIEGLAPGDFFELSSKCTRTVSSSQ